MPLNIPDTRQTILAGRLSQGQHIVASEAAQEFDVSLDTIRRDILALETAGHAQKVRGGAMPIAHPAHPLHLRLFHKDSISPALIDLAVAHIGDAATLIVDGGATTLALVENLPPHPERLIITPSPWVAIACQTRGIDAFLLGGTLSASGGIAVGGTGLQQVQNTAADIAILGACGLDPDFGLSADDFAETQMKQAMHRAAQRTFVVTTSAKLGLRARFHTLPLDQIDTVIADASPDQVQTFHHAGAAIAAP